MEKQCKRCSKKFQTSFWWQVYCCHPCYIEDTRGKPRPKVKESLRKFHTDHPGYFKQFPNSGRFQKDHQVPQEWRDKRLQKFVNYWASEESKRRMSESRIRYLFEHPEVMVILGQNQSGARHWNWKGGISDPMHLLRHTTEYNEWRLAVYSRDEYRCRTCGSKKDIIAHHILPFKDYPLVRFSVENGMTLCRSCHKRLHSEVGKSTQFKPRISESRLTRILVEDGRNFISRKEAEA